MRTPAPQTPAFAVPGARTWRAIRVVPWMKSEERGRLGPSRTAAHRTAHRPGGRGARRRPDAGDDWCGAGWLAPGHRPVGRTLRRRRGRCRLERAAEAAHPDGEVVLHDLADLRLGEHLVRVDAGIDACRGAYSALVMSA